MIENRIGKIEIDKSYLQKETGLFSKLNPIHIEMETYGIYIFTCVTEYFDEIEEGEKVPFYDVTITRKGNHLDYEFERR